MATLYYLRLVFLRVLSKTKRYPVHGSDTICEGSLPYPLNRSMFEPQNSSGRFKDRKNSLHADPLVW